MIAAAYGSVSDIEILFTLLAAIGIAFSAYTLSRAVGDKRFINHAGILNGRRRLARYAVWAEITRAIKQLIFLVIGILAMTRPEVPPDAGLTLGQNLVRFFFTWGLITATALTTFQSFLAYMVRREYSKE